MKKVLPFIAILLALLLTFSSCAGCNQKTTPTDEPTVETTVAPTEDPSKTEPTEPSEDPGVEIDQEFVDKAADMIYEFYKPGKTATVSADFTLPSTVKYQGVDVEIEWVVVSGDQYARIAPSDYENLINVIVNKSSSGGPFTLKGIVKAGNYTKEIEFNYELVSQYDLLVAAYALTGDEKIENSTLTGVISKVNTPYDPSYGNITVTIIVDGHEDMPIMCYRLKGDGVDTIKVGDTITVFGTLVNYNGTIEFTTGCTLVSIDAVGEEIPDNSPVFDSQRDIVNAAYALPGGDYLSQTKTYTLTGVVSKMVTPYDSSYQNVTVDIVVEGMTDKPIRCYRMKGADADKVKVTDTIQVTGKLMNYVSSTSGKSTIEFEAGCTLDKIVAVGDGKAPSGIKLNAVKPEPGKPYKLVMAQNEVNKKLYFDGGKKGNFLTTTTSFANSVDVYVEAVSGGYNIYYTYNGKKTYITLQDNGVTDKNIQKAKIVLSDKAGIPFTYNSTYNTMYASVKNAPFYMGAYNDFETFSASSTSYLEKQPPVVDISQFPARFEVSDGKGKTSGNSSSEEQPSNDGKTTVVETSPVTGKSYKLQINQKNENKILYFNGTVANTYYLGTTQVIDQGVDVTLEAASGGYYVSFKTSNGAKKYLAIEKSADGAHTNAVMTDSKKCVFTIDKTYNTIVTKIGDTTYYMGTYNNFTTISASEYSHLEGGKCDTESFPVRFANVVDSNALTDEQKVNAEYDSLNLTPTTYTEATKVTLPTPKTHTDVKITWKSDSNYAKVSGKELVITLPEKEANAKVTATLSLGNVSKEKTFELTIKKPAAVSTEEPEPGTAYKMFINREKASSNNKVYYITGEKDGNFFATDISLAKSVDVFVEKKNGNPYIYFTNSKGEKKYLDILVNSSNKVVVEVVNEPTAVFKWNKDYRTYVATVNNKEYCFGTYNNFTTISPSQTSYITETNFDVEQFPAHFVKASEATESEVTDEEKVAEEKNALTLSPNKVTEAPSEIVLPTAKNKDIEITWTSSDSALAKIQDGKIVVETLPSATTAVTITATLKLNAVADTKAFTLTIEAAATPEEPEEPKESFKMLIDRRKGSTSNNLVYYFTGKKDGNYLAADADIEKAVDLYFVEEGEGFRIYFLDEEDKKQYIDISEYDPTNHKVGVDITETPSAVFTYLEKYDTYVTTVNGTSYYFGTWNNYVNFSANLETRLTDETYDVTQFPAHFVKNEEEPEEPEEPKESFKMLIDRRKGSTSNNLVYYFTGKKDGNYLAADADIEKAVDLYFVEEGEGFRIYFLDEEDKKQYIDISEYDPTNHKVGVDITETPSAVFTYLEKYDTYVTTVNGTSYYFGTWNNYVNFSANLETRLTDETYDVTQFPAHFVKNEEEPEEPGTDPGTGETLEAKYVVADQKYEDKQDVTTITINDITIVFDAGSNTQNPPKYYNTGSAVRLYGNNTVTISCAEGAKIEKIEFTFADNYNNKELTANTGTYNAGVWTGSESSVKFTAVSGGGHARLLEILIVYKK